MARLISPLCLIVLSAVAHAQMENGLDLSDSEIDRVVIRQGGPPRDSIPPVDEPVFVAASAAEFLQADDRLIGVHRNGVAKTYPIRILDWHEVVNDKFAGDATTLITSCPLAADEDYLPTKLLNIMMRACL